MNQRPGLDQRTFTDEHIALDHRLAVRLAKLPRSQIGEKIVTDARDHLPHLVKRAEQARVIRLVKVKQVFSSRNT